MRKGWGGWGKYRFYKKSTPLSNLCLQIYNAIANLPKFSLLALSISKETQSNNEIKAIQNKREAIIKIAAKHGAFNVRIFGSVARGEELDDSDIDFLIDYDLSKITPWFPGGLLMDLEKLLQCKVDLVTDKGLSPLIQERVLNEARPL